MRHWTVRRGIIKCKYRECKTYIEGMYLGASSRKSSWRLTRAWETLSVDMIWLLGEGIGKGRSPDIVVESYNFSKPKKAKNCYAKLDTTPASRSEQRRAPKSQTWLVLPLRVDPSMREPLRVSSDQTTPASRTGNLESKVPGIFAILGDFVRTNKKHIFWQGLGTWMQVLQPRIFLTECTTSKSIQKVLFVKL